MLTRESIVDAALECVERTSWEAVRLHELAAAAAADYRE